MPPHSNLTCARCGVSYHRPPSSAGLYCSFQCYWDDRYPRAVARFWEQIDRSGECWLWTGALLSGGYGSLSVSGKTVGAHVFSYELHNGPVPDRLFVCHNCPGGDNPRCVNPAHLWLGTNGDNTRDQIAKGRRPRGEGHFRTTLTEQDVRVIRDRYAAGGVSQRALGHEFGVSQTAIWHILQRHCWQHV